MATKSLSKIVQEEAYHIVYWQLVGITILAVLALLVSGKTNGLSVFAGGLAYALPNLVFVWRVFRYAGAQQMNLFVAAFIVGEMMKLILSGIVFLIIVKYLPVSLLSTLVGLAGAMVSFWIVCFWRFSRQTSN